MDRQKSRARQINSGFLRPGYSIDGISRPVQSSRPMPLFNEPRQPVFREPLKPHPTPPLVPSDLSSDFVKQPVAAQAALTPTPQAADRQSLGPVPNQSIIGATLPANAFSTDRHATPKTKSKFRRILKPGLISLAVALIGFGAWFGTSVMGSINKVFHGNVFSDAHALLSGSPLKESNGRVNILLAGDSADDPSHRGAGLADSIMVISYSPSSKSGFILSVPRDLWVDIPSLGHQKINAANDVTNFRAPGLPAGGMGQLQQIVQNDFGIPIDYEALIDYTAFKLSLIHI